MEIFILIGIVVVFFVGVGIYAEIKERYDEPIRTFDLDGVINLDEMGVGLRPTSDRDIIITGRSYEESEETFKFLDKNEINNMVYFNPLPFSAKTRKSSGEHKAKILNQLKKEGYEILFHVEDDPLQIKEINQRCDVTVIHFNSQGIVELENVKRK